jgi:hypothetical protein
MAVVVLIVPDLTTPSGVRLHELRNLHSAFLEAHGVLVVEEEEGSGAIYLGPAAWHSFTKAPGDSRSLIQRLSLPTDAADVGEDQADAESMAAG